MSTMFLVGIGGIVVIGRCCGLFYVVASGAFYNDVPLYVVLVDYGGLSRFE